MKREVIEREVRQKVRVVVVTFTLDEVKEALLVHNLSNHFPGAVDASSNADGTVILEVREDAPTDYGNLELFLKRVHERRSVDPEIEKLVDKILGG